MKIPLMHLPDEDAYRAYFEEKYCHEPVITYDNYPVYFKRDMFEHSFFIRSSRKGEKDTFSIDRAERMDWIVHILKDTTVELYFGWDNQSKKPALDRRVAVLHDEYVVVIRFNEKMNKAFFVTAFMIDDQRVLKKIRSNPKWVKK